MLAAEGYGWGVPDDELSARLEAMAAVHPPLVPLDANLVTEGLWLVVTPTHRVTLAPTTAAPRNVEQSRQAESVAVVRPISKDGQRGPPVAWTVSALRPVGPGRPLVIADAEGFEHRFGVVESVTRLREDYRSLTGLKRRSVGDRVWFIRTDAETIILDHGLHIVERKNRELIRTDFSWHTIEEGEVGKALRVQLSRGTLHTFGCIKELILAESAPWNESVSPY
ncbi:hypothetical protein HMPREF2806_09965 [Corynebacterium sp. HMSC076G08]|nr:hypothetical protein HMPREF2806_09965 [Corynebacterium sp. HMSC076G08]